MRRSFARRKTLADIDIQTAMSRGDKTDLADFLTDVENIVLLPEFENVSEYRIK